MIKATFIIDITSKITDQLNYKERICELIIDSKEKYTVNLRAVIDRAYNETYNSYKDFYKKLGFKYNGHFYPVYIGEELRLLALSVGGKDNLKLGKIVGMWHIYHGREVVIFFVYE